jgi:hypothetical protein
MIYFVAPLDPLYLYLRLSAIPSKLACLSIYFSNRIKKKKKPSVTQAGNPRTWEAEAGGP